MLLEIEDAIINRLSEKGIQAYGWSGKPDELFLKPKLLPAVRVVIEKVDFKEMYYVGHYGCIVQIFVLVFWRSLRDVGQGAYEIIERVINALSGYKAFGFDLIVKSLNLLYHEAGEFCYQIQFVGYGKYIVAEDVSEVLTTRIKTYEGEELISEVSQ